MVRSTKLAGYDEKLIKLGMAAIYRQELPIWMYDSYNDCESDRAAYRRFYKICTLEWPEAYVALGAVKVNQFKMHDGSKRWGLGFEYQGEAGQRLPLEATLAQTDREHSLSDFPIRPASEAPTAVQPPVNDPPPKRVDPLEEYIAQGKWRQPVATPDSEALGPGDKPEDKLPLDPSIPGMHEHEENEYGACRICHKPKEVW